MKTLKIHESRIDDFAARIEKLAARAAKLKVTPPTFAVTDKELRTVYHNGQPLKTFDGQVVRERWFTIEVTEPVVKLPGWDFLGTVQHTPAGNILRTVPTAVVADGELATYRFKANDCDHCHTARQRNDTYLVRRCADGAVMQVGSGCINDFLGADFLSTFQFVLDMGLGDEGEWGSSGGSMPWLWSRAQVLTLAATAIRTVGWVSSTMARESQGDKTSTANVVFAVLTAFTVEQQKHVAAEYPKVWDALKGGIPACDVEMAEAAAAWVAALPADVTSDYLHNLRIACAPSVVSHREIGLVVSAVSAWQREHEKIIAAAKAAAAPPSEWLGNVGDRVGKALSSKDKKAGVAAIPEQVGKIVVLKTFSTNFGVTTLVKIVTDAGNAVAWFASGDLEVKLGDRVRMAGTIKSLDLYNGQKQTILTRATVTRI